MAVAANKDQREIPENWLSYPSLEEGVEGVRFIEAVVKSHQENFKAVDL